MTNYSPISKKSQYLADKACLVDSASISKIFTDIKKKDMLIEPIEINTNDYIQKSNFERKNIVQGKFNDYIDQFIYYRILQGYTQEQVGQVIGVSGKSYWKYEKRVHELKDINKIKKIADFLGIQEIIKMPQEKHRINNTEIKSYLMENHINNTQFSQAIGVSRRTVIDWFNKNVYISDKNYTKIEKFIKDNEMKKHNIEIEEMEEF